MSDVIVVVESDGKGLYELCVAEHDGDTRLRHEDYILNREGLHNLKQQVDRAWFGYVEETQ